MLSIDNSGYLFLIPNEVLQKYNQDGQNTVSQLHTIVCNYKLGKRPITTTLIDDIYEQLGRRIPEHDVQLIIAHNQLFIDTFGIPTVLSTSSGISNNIGLKSMFLKRILNAQHDDVITHANTAGLPVKYILTDKIVPVIYTIVKQPFYTKELYEVVLTYVISKMNMLLGTERTMLNKVFYMYNKHLYTQTVFKEPKSNLSQYERMENGIHPE